jgi:hypothetical protein
MRSLVMVLVIAAGCSSASEPRVDRGRDLVVRDMLPPEARDLAEARVDVAPCKLIKPYSTKNALCNTCAEQRCCDEVNGCLGDAACDDDYVNCTLACALAPAPDAGVSACLAQCGKDYPKGKAEYAAAIGCADTKCAAECQ